LYYTGFRRLRIGFVFFLGAKFRQWSLQPAEGATTAGHRKKNVSNERRSIEIGEKIG
jgi:hypothetical protein